MISGILLAAGESRRFGSPKALVEINHRSIISVLQQRLLDCGLDEIVVVLGAHRESIEPHVFNHTKVRVVYNKDYKLGQTSSFQAGIAASSEKNHGFLLLPVDYAWISGATINKLIAHFNAEHPAILIPVFEGHRGHPPIFNTALKHEILTLSPSHGVNELFGRYPPALLDVNDPGVIKTFNTHEELEKIQNPT